MLRAAAIWHHVRQKDARRIREENGKKLTPEQQELRMLIESDPSQITDLNISQNSDAIINFTKLPWTEWFMALVFLIAAMFPTVYVEVMHLQGEK